MPNWFYIDTNGQYQGPVDSQQLKSLAVQGVVSPETLLITDGGKKGKAGQLRGLIDQGLSTETASIVVANIEQQINAVKKSSGSKNMIWGAIWCIGGTVVTVATFSAAAEGGRFVLAWGAILFGGIQFLYGLAEYFTNSNHT